MGTIVFSITHGFQARNLLQTDVAPLLMKRGYKLLVVSPMAASDHFREQFSDSGIDFVVGENRAGRLSTFFSVARRYALANPRRNATNNLFNEQFSTSRKPHYILLRGLNRAVGRFPRLREKWMRLEGLLIAGREWDAVLRSAKPVLVVTGSPGTTPLDAALLRSAERLGIPTACVVLSWDNLTSKGYMAARPERLIVWNERMRREAIEFHDYTPEAVDVAGVAHFDIYSRPELHLTRADVCRRLGADPCRPIVLFGTVSPVLFPNNVAIAEILAEAAARGSINQNAQLAIRVHPQSAGGGPYGDSLDAYRDLQSRYPRVVSLDIPRVVGGALQWALPQDEMVWLTSLLKEAAVCVNVASTLAIDAALADTPVICVAFDGRSELPYRQSIRRAYDYTHYRPIVEAGGAPLATSPEELIGLINSYISDRGLHRQGRKRIAEEQAWKLDGRSGERVAAALLEIVS